MSQLLCRELLENELIRYNEKPTPKTTFNERDRRLVTAYRSFIRFNILKQKRELVLDDHIFATLANYLCTTPKISYDEFRVISGVAPPSANKYFTAKCFLKFPQDENHCISSEDLVRYIERSMEIESITLSLMESVAPGQDPLLTSLTEQQIETFALKMISEIDILQRMPEAFHEYYAYTAAAKFMFFLDLRHTNLISIKKIAHSKEMEELLALRKLSLQIASSNLSIQEVEAQLSKNWFSDNNAEKIYTTFLQLDKNQKGTLTMNEVGDFAGLNPRKRINFTQLAWERIFQEYIPYIPMELDYKNFIHLILAIENPTTIASIRYFWKILDYDRSGRLTPLKIKYFYNDIYASLVGSYDVPSADYIVTEIYDLLACNNNDGATLEDVIQSKQGHIVMSMLLDVNGFWRYDNRESLMGAEEEEGGDQMPEAAVVGDPASDALEVLLEVAHTSTGSSSAYNSGSSKSVVGSVLAESEDHHTTTKTVSSAAKSRLLSQIGQNSDDDEGEGEGYDNSFEQFDDELFSEDDAPLRSTTSR